MSRPKTPRKNKSNVVPMTPEAPASVAVAEPEPETPFDPAPPAAEAKTSPSPTPKAKRLSFFERVKQVPKPDWGTRAFIYVYCWEPICNLKMGGENKYLVRLSEPILDEQPLMVDYGSGKYHLKLVFRKAGGGEGEMMDTTEVEIYNPKYPPKIPRSVWMNDPRNERWAALLPKEEPPVAPTGLGTLTDAFKTFGDIRRDLKEEMGPAAAAPVPIGDPMGNALQMVQTIMAMKADNPMVEIMKAQLQAVNDQAEKARDREANLQKELREMMIRMTERKPAAESAEKKFGLREALGELKEFMPAIKEIIPEVAARSGRTSWLDVAREVAPGVIDWGGRIALALASRMPPPAQGQPGQQPPAQIAAPPASGQQPQAQQPPPQEVPAFFRYLAQPAVFGAFQRYFANFKAGEETGGADFANWVYDGGGADPLKQARAVGSAAIMQSLKASPQVWFMFQADEAKLSEFIDQTLGWNPDEAPPADGDDDEDDNVDLTKKGV